MLSTIIIVLILAVLLVHIVNNYLVYTQFPEHPATHLAQLYTKDSYTKSKFYYRGMALMQGSKYIVQSIALIILIGFGLFNYLDLWLLENLSTDYLILGAMFLVIYSGFTALIEWPFKAWERVINYKLKGKDVNTFDKVTDTTECFTETLVKAVTSWVILIPINFIVIYGMSELTPYKVLQLGIFLILVIALAPEFFNRIVVPFKYKLDVCKDAVVIDSINDLTATLGYKKPLVQVLRNSTNQANALVIGRKNKMRIILDPKLLDEFSQDEIKAVLAHEFGHIHHKHLYKGVASLFLIFAIVLGVMVAVAYNPELAHHFGMQNTGIHISLLIATLIFQPIGLVAKALVNWQNQKREKEADIFAVHITKNVEGLISAFRRFYQTNYVHPNLHPFSLLVDHTHPPIATRINHLLKEAGKV